MSSQPRPGVLSDDEVRERLADLDDWTFEGGALRRHLEFDDFVAAFGFMARVALVAEKMDHHPDWSNSWNTVDVAVVNHAAGGVSDACFDLAAAIDRLL